MRRLDIEGERVKSGLRPGFERFNLMIPTELKVRLERYAVGVPGVRPELTITEAMRFLLEKALKEEERFEGIVAAFNESQG